MMAMAKLAQRWAKLPKLMRGGAAPMQLDFGKPQQRPYRTGLVLLGCSAMLLAYTFAQSDRAREQVALLEGQIAARGGMKKLDRPKEALAGAPGSEMDLRIRKANRVIQQLSTPWADVFGGIEAAGDKDVALLGMESDPLTGKVRVSAEARNAGGMVRYLERLRADGRLSPAVLLAHQVMVEDPNRPIRFTFSASWTSVKKSTF